MVIVEHLPDDSATKRAQRDGDWSESEYIRATEVNEIRLMRAEMRAMLGNQSSNPKLIESPSQRTESEDKRAQASNWNAHVTAQMRAAQNANEKEVISVRA